MNFLEYKHASGNKLKVNDIVLFTRRNFACIITKIKEHKVQILSPVRIGNTRNYYVRNGEVNLFIETKDDLQVNNKASQILRFASSKIKQLAEEYNG